VPNKNPVGSVEEALKNATVPAYAEKRSVTYYGGVRNKMGGNVRVRRGGSNVRDRVRARQLCALLVVLWSFNRKRV
jgi:hypothetical protein